MHAHQATSTMVNEAVTYACEMGLASVYTDHSLFGFDDIASIKLNRLSSVDGFLLIPWWIVFFPGICKLISVLGSNPGVEINIANLRCRNLCFTHLS